MCFSMISEVIVEPSGREILSLVISFTTLLRSFPRYSASRVED